jgi:hypothetical protein
MPNLINPPSSILDGETKRAKVYLWERKSSLCAFWPRNRLLVLRKKQKTKRYWWKIFLELCFLKI